MAGMKSLAKDTAIYGLSSILGRFLNWCFVFLYINVLKTTAEYGIVTNLYAYMALLLIILTYGMETGFFRFANDKEEKEPQRVYTTGLISLATTSTLFFVLVWVFITPLSRLLGYPEHEDYVLMMAAIIAVDAFTALPFAYLRYRRRPIRFYQIVFDIPEHSIEFVFHSALSVAVWYSPRVDFLVFRPRFFGGIYIGLECHQFGSCIVGFVPRDFRDTLSVRPAFVVTHVEIFFSIINFGDRRYYEPNLRQDVLSSTGKQSPGCHVGTRHIRCGL